MDRWGDHALVCSCNGDRTLRHNAVRDATFCEAIDAGVDAEREKAGLLPGRPPEDGIPISSGSRRPADIWLRRGRHGGQEAFDFAVTSGLKSDLYRAVAEDAGTVFAEYDSFKRQYKSTDQLCHNQGLCFTPMVLEAHGGGWSPLVRGVDPSKGERAGYLAATNREGDSCNGQAWGKLLDSPAW